MNWLWNLLSQGFSSPSGDSFSLIISDSGCSDSVSMPDTSSTYSSSGIQWDSGVSLQSPTDPFSSGW